MAAGARCAVESRDTTCATPGGRVQRRGAQDYIEAHALVGISAADVIEHLHVSRSLANLRFRELTGQSIGQRILGVRLAEVQRLLKTTGWPLGRIAQAVGFSGPDTLRNLFRARYGHGPTHGRAQTSATRRGGGMV